MCICSPISWVAVQPPRGEGTSALRLSISISPSCLHQLQQKLSSSHESGQHRSPVRTPRSTGVWVAGSHSQQVIPSHQLSSYLSSLKRLLKLDGSFLYQQKLIYTQPSAVTSWSQCFITADFCPAHEDFGIVFSPSWRTEVIRANQGVSHQ